MLGDNIVVRTWIETTRNASCERQYEITRASDGAVLATAMTEWAFVDLKTGRPKRIPPELAADFA